MEPAPEVAGSQYHQAPPRAHRCAALLRAQRRDPPIGTARARVRLWSAIPAQGMPTPLPKQTVPPQACRNTPARNDGTPGRTHQRGPSGEWHLEFRQAIVTCTQRTGSCETARYIKPFFLQSTMKCAARNSGRRSSFMLWGNVGAALRWLARRANRSTIALADLPAAPSVGSVSGRFILMRCLMTKAHQWCGTREAFWLARTVSATDASQRETWRPTGKQLRRNRSRFFKRGRCWNQKSQRS